MDLHASGDERLRFHLVTRPWTRKAALLRAADAVTITFHDPREQGENGYCALSGRLRELDCQQQPPEERRHRRRHSAAPRATGDGHERR